MVAFAQEDFMTRYSALALTFGLSLILSCGDKDDTGTEPPVEYEGDEAGECTDGADNDQDGLFDCDDEGCAGSPDCDETDTDEDTGYPDTDTTINPWDALGTWTTTWGYELFNESCGIPDLTPSSETWINNATMYVDGTPPTDLVAHFGSDEDEVFDGVVTEAGGIVFTGLHHRRDGYTAHVSFGGLLRYDAYLQRDVIEGFLYMGLDLTGDGNIECEAQGEFTARKSSD